MESKPEKPGKHFEAGGFKIRQNNLANVEPGLSMLESVVKRVALEDPKLAQALEPQVQQSRRARQGVMRG